MHRLVVSALFALPIILSLQVTSSLGGEKTQRTYICKSGTVIWNQAEPCDKDTPERKAVAERIRNQTSPAPPEVPVHKQSSKPNVAANIGQIQAFPEKHLDVNLILSAVALRGNIFRGDSRLPEGKRSIAVIEDSFGRSLPAVLDDDRGLKFSKTLEPDLSYAVDKAVLEIRRVEGGYLVYAKGLIFSEEPPRDAGVVNFNDKPDPIIPAIGIKNEEQAGGDFTDRPAVISQNMPEAPSLQGQSDLVQKALDRLPELLKVFGGNIPQGLEGLDGQPEDKKQKRNNSFDINNVE